MTEEQQKTFDDCKDQAAGEHLNKEGYPFLTYKEARQQVTGFINDEIVDRAMQLYGDKMFEEGRLEGRREIIAAAPDMLEALKEALPGLEELNNEFQEGWEFTIEKVASAIKKATGE